MGRRSPMDEIVERPATSRRVTTGLKQLGKRALAQRTSAVTAALIGLILTFSLLNAEAFATIPNFRNIANRRIDPARPRRRRHVRDHQRGARPLDRLGAHVQLRRRGAGHDRGGRKHVGDHCGRTRRGARFGRGLGLDQRASCGPAKAQPADRHSGDAGHGSGACADADRWHQHHPGPTEGVRNRDRTPWGVPYLVIISGVLTLVFGAILALTAYGRYTYAIGSSEEAARRAGIRVERHITSVYVFSGTLAGLAGCCSCGSRPPASRPTRWLR